MKETLELLGLNKTAAREITTIINNLLLIDPEIQDLGTEKDLILTELVLKSSKEIMSEETAVEEKIILLRQLQKMMNDLRKEIDVISIKTSKINEETQRIPNKTKTIISAETNQMIEKSEERLIEEMKNIIRSQQKGQQTTNEKIDLLRTEFKIFLESRRRENAKEINYLLDSINQNKELVMEELRKIRENIGEMNAENVAFQKEFLQKIDSILELDLSSSLDQTLFEERMQDVLKFLYSIKNRMGTIEKQLELLAMGQENISYELIQQTEQGEEIQQELLERLMDIQKRIDMNELQKINYEWQEMRKAQDPKTKIQKLSGLIFKVFKWGLKGIAAGMELLKIAGGIDLLF
ncbi:MAG: hypothetical protein GF308_07715 [Candidatus Heimdallarchaeota archaeon]|nr:hypothetical protein [Candidatus Heimdallarchaeota archaeon]